MSLATRLSAFFLIALALVLVGFSGTLYLLARTYLVRQLDERLQRALDTLEAPVDIEPGGLEWEPTDRADRRGRGHGDQRSAVGGPRRPRGPGRPLGELPAERDSPPTGSPRLGRPSLADGTAFGGIPGLAAGRAEARAGELLRQGRGHPDDEPGYEVQYPVLVLVVGLSPAPTEATLGRWG